MERMAYKLARHSPAGETLEITSEYQLLFLDVLLVFLHLGLAPRSDDLLLLAAVGLLVLLLDRFVFPAECL